ncbi:MAG: PaaI family thioesterase [Firmicutes bacterium]|nr:PaaI family thioesterase [Bacillota bacterium]
MDFVDDNYCFCCGKLNPIGMKLDFHYSNEQLSAEVAFPREFQGFAGIVHGGMVAAVLDEVMVWLLMKKGIKAVTGQMDVKFRKPVFINENLKFTAELKGRADSRAIKVAARAERDDGTVVADSNGTFIKVG